MFKERFKNNKLIEPHKLLLKGKAGIGKTTLCRYICHSWSGASMGNEMMENLFVDKFDWIFMITLKRVVQLFPNKISSTSITEILFEYYLEGN